MRMRFLFIISVGILGISVPLLTFAQSSPPPPSIAEHIVTFYKFSLGIAGALAMAMIVVGSLYYSLSGVADKKNEGKEFITSALYGFVLLLGAYLILNTINPELTQLRDVGCPSSGACKIATSTFEYSPASLAAASNCGDFSSIPLWNHQSVIGSYTCSAPGIIYDGTSNFSIGGDDYFYNETFSETITPGTKIWVHPYYNTSLGTSSARCIIYAYQSAPTPQNPNPEWKSISTRAGKIQRCTGEFTESAAASPQLTAPARPVACDEPPATIYSPGYQRTLNCATEQQTSPGSTLTFSAGVWYSEDVIIRPSSQIWVRPYYRQGTGWAETACLIYKYNPNGGEITVPLSGGVFACSDE